VFAVERADDGTGWCIFADFKNGHLLHSRFLFGGGIDRLRCQSLTDEEESEEKNRSRKERGEWSLKGELFHGLKRGENG
jgi:hypothetical protein